MRGMWIAVALWGCVSQAEQNDILDRDDDGFLPIDAGGDDCDDADPTVHPGAAEQCGDGVDNNCDGATDDRGEGATSVWPDADEDGLGDPEAEALACALADGWVRNGDDCDDTDADVGLPEMLHADADADGIGGGAATLVCPGPDWVATGGDCDDTDPTIGEGTPTLLFWDADGDGVGGGAGETRCPEPGWVSDGGDCDDADPSVYGPELRYVDADGDGIGGGSPFPACDAAGLVAVGGDCDDQEPMVGVGTPADLWTDADADGYGTGSPVWHCPQAGWAPVSGDCDDGRADVHPGAIEETCDGRDNDCALATPDGPVLADGVAYPTLQEAIDLGVGDLSVCPGVYAEALTVGRSVAIAPLRSGDVVELVPPAGPAVRVDGGGAVALRELVLRGGQGATDAAGRWLGGTLANLDPATTLTVDACAIDAGTADYGAVIASSGPLVVTGTAVADGEVAVDGGCIWAGGDLTLRDGATVGGCTAAFGSGGGIYVEGTFSADGTVRVADNRAWFGGGLYVAPGGVAFLDPQTQVADNAAPDGYGGGAFASGTLIQGGTFTGNSAAAGGAVALDGGTLQDASLTGNEGLQFGGGLYGYGSLIDCALSQNTAGLDGGGAYAIEALVVSNSTFDGNVAETGGGVWSMSALTLEEVALTGNVATDGNGGGAFATGSLQLAGAVTFAFNEAVEGGGLALGGTLDTAAATSLIWTGNTAAVGGGLWASGLVGGAPEDLAVLDLSAAAFTANAADEGGGAALHQLHLVGGQFSANTAVTGGGVSLTDSWWEGGEATDNVATGDGGGLAAAGSVLTDLWVEGNSAARGGGVANHSGGALTVDGCTVTANAASDSGGGFWHGGSLFGLSLSDTEVALNTAVDGGGLYVAGTDVYLGQSTFGVALGPVTLTGNDASGDGGGLHLSAVCPGPFLCIGDPFALATALVVTDNTADGRGGGAYFDQTSATLTAGAWTANTAERGGAFALRSVGVTAPTRLISLTGTAVTSNIAQTIQMGNGAYIDGTPLGTGAIASTNATWSNSGEDVADSNNHQFDATGIPTFSCGYNLGCSVGN